MSAVTPEQPKIILHWLNYSRATRVIWLLELLNLKYEMKLYERGAGMRAPPELKEVHPLGKSPMIEVNGKVIAESGLIFQYLLKKFDPKHILTPDSEDEQWDVDYYLHYAEGTLMPNLVAILVMGMSKAGVPKEQQEVYGKAVDVVCDGFFLKEIEANLEFLNSELEGKSYFVAGKLTGADIMLSFALESVLSGKQIKLDLSKYPNLLKWRETIHKEASYIKAEEIREKYESKAQHKF